MALPHWTSQQVLPPGRHACDLADVYERLVFDVLVRGDTAGAFDVIDAKLTTYAIIAQASHVGTWYQALGRLTLEQVTDIQVGLALRLAGAEAVPRAEVTRLVAEVAAFHEQRL